MGLRYRLSRSGKHNPARRAALVEMLEDRLHLATQMVVDWNTGTAGSLPHSLTPVGNMLYFVATTGTTGSELWKTDGTAAGTMRVKDINPGPDGSYPTALTNVNGILYFAASEPTGGQELWRSDGTAAGTYRVIDLQPGAESSSPTGLAAFGGSVLFSDSFRRLWRSDGAAGGTVMLKDDSSVGYWQPPVVVGNRAYFTVVSALWKTDGTAAGTVEVPLPQSNLSNISSMTEFKGFLLFTAMEQVGGQYSTCIWKTDGTTAGTTKLAGGGLVYSAPQQLINAAGSLFFIANDGAGAQSLWKSDGTVAGTREVPGITVADPAKPAAVPGGMRALGNAVLLPAGTQTTGLELWRSDGTAEGTYLLKDIAPGSARSAPRSLVNVNGTVYFFADEGEDNTALWKTNGTTAGTAKISRIDPRVPTDGGRAVAFRDALAFAAYDPDNGLELWRSNGTAAGTHLIRDVNQAPNGGGAAQPVAVVGDRVLVVNWTAGVTPELFSSDGTAAGTWRVKDFPTTGNFRMPMSFFQTRTATYFVDLNTDLGPALWRTDGTAAGTAMLKRFSQGWGDMSSFTELDGAVYFLAITFSESWEMQTQLWRTDGTVSGTTMVKAVPTQNTMVGFRKAMALVGDTLYFVAVDSLRGAELWSSDGTAAGTTLVKNGLGINWTAPALGGPELTAVNNTLYFTNWDAAAGRELWKSDGTAAGTVLVKDIIPGVGGSTPRELYNLNGTLLFIAPPAGDGTGDPGALRLWRSDGTANGTTPVADVPVWTQDQYDGQGSYWDLASARIGDTLYFRNGSTGSQLWRTDGTEAGTVLVADVGGASPLRFTGVVNGVLFFSADDGVHGRELWRSDGTAAGTAMVADINPGAASSEAAGLLAAGDVLFFGADDGTHGHDLWKWEANASPLADAGSAYVINEGGTLILDASGSSDYEGEALTYAWDLNDDGVFTDATGVKPTLTWQQLRSLGLSTTTPAQVRVRVSDTFGHLATSLPTTLTLKPTPPTATVQVGDAVTYGGTHSFTITYRDLTAVKRSTLDSFDVRVFNASNGFNALATLIGVSGSGDASALTATYAISGPGGTWDAADNGTYTIRLEAGHVSDTLGASAPTAELGSFRASVLTREHSGVLQIDGTDAADTILVTQSGPLLTVTRGGVASSYTGVTGLLISGLGGNDRITLDASVTLPATISGGTGHDSITGGSAADVLKGGGGNDTLLGIGGADRILGNGGRDLLVGGAGADQLSGGGGNDTLRGNGGPDTLTGGAGADLLIGAGGNDRLLARDAPAADTLTGGAGTDLAQVDSLLDVVTGIETLLA